MDTPHDLYHHPVNLFVAAFIGSPSMNLVEAKVEGREIVFGSNRMPLAEGVDLRDREGQTIVLGIRPSDFEDADLARETGNPVMDVTIEVTEELGSEVYVVFGVDAPAVVSEDVKAAADEDDEGPALLIHDDAGRRSTFTARVDAATRARPGQPLRLAVDNERFYFFDPATGRSLLAGTPVGATT